MVCVILFCYLTTDNDNIPFDKSPGQEISPNEFVLGNVL